MFRRLLPAVLVFAVGASAGWLAHRPKAAAPTADARTDFGGEVTVRRGFGPTETFTPHSAHVNGKPVYLIAPPAPGTEVTLFALDGGRVQIACTPSP